MISECLSGEGKCEIVEPICYVAGQCDGKVLNVTEDVFERLVLFKYLKSHPKVL
jgi:hypothetical protein